MLLYAFNYFSRVAASKAKAKKDPILVYAPTSFSPGYISSIAKVLKTVLNKFGLTGMIYYEPNIFRDRGIQPKGLGTLIYSYRY
jgi:hypothetical protein